MFDRLFYSYVCTSLHFRSFTQHFIRYNLDILFDELSYRRDLMPVSLDVKSFDFGSKKINWCKFDQPVLLIIHHVLGWKTTTNFILFIHENFKALFMKPVNNKTDRVEYIHDLELYQNQTMDIIFGSATHKNTCPRPVKVIIRC